MPELPAHAARRPGGSSGGCSSSSSLQLEFDQLDRVAIRRVRVGGVVDRERVERIAVARRVDLRLEDRQPAAAEEAADAREQVLLVGQVDHHLQARLGARQPRAHDRRRSLDAPVEVPRVPGDLVGGVALEVDVVEPRPQRALGAVGHRVQAQQALRLALALRAGCRRAWPAPRRPRAARASRGTGPRAAAPSTRSTPCGLVPRMSATVSR